MSTKVWAMMCQLLPDLEGNIKVVMGHSTYETEDEANEAIRKARAQNLPFRAWAVSFPDPRQETA